MQRIMCRVKRFLCAGPPRWSPRSVPLPCDCRTGPPESGPDLRPFAHGGEREICSLNDFLRTHTQRVVARVKRTPVLLEWNCVEISLCCTFSLLNRLCSPFYLRKLRIWRDLRELASEIKFGRKLATGILSSLNWRLVLSLGRYTLYLNQN
jgi:hypothetical protein